MMQTHFRTMAAAAVAAIALTGCNKKADDSGNLKSAINNYFSAHPECLFRAAKKFPVQADTKNATDTAPWDALVDQGLLTRTTAEKSKLLVLTKDVNNYDLSDKGRSAWTPDPQQPGFGNFCYAKRTVTQVTSYTPVGSTQPGVATTANYTYTLGSVADWARAGGVQTAYPALKAKLDGAGSAIATLTLTSNGWQMQAPATPAASGDVGIVE